MKEFSIFAICVFVVSMIMAQTPQEEYELWKHKSHGNYTEYRDKTVADYVTYRDKINAEYAEFVKKAWSRVKVSTAEKPPKSPEPPNLPQMPIGEKPTSEPIIYCEKKRPGDDTVSNIKLPPSVLPVEGEVPIIEFDYYGTVVTLHIDRKGLFALKEITPQALSEAWRQVMEMELDWLLRDCIVIKDTLRLCDWGYVQLIEKAVVAVFGKECNEATLLEYFILCNSRVRCLLGYDGDRLVILMPFDCEVYNRQYVQVKEEVFYMLSKNIKESEALSVLTEEFPDVQNISLRMEQLPKLNDSHGQKWQLESLISPAMRCNVVVSRNMIDFLNDYPLTSKWNYYAQSSLSEPIKQQIYPTLRKQLAGMTEQGAVNALLQWIQTALEYMTDDEQFGYERPLFGDESLFYPYCDCEDRSILFSILVKDLLGLDVVLLDYPEHLATAVRFSKPIEGDYLDLKDGRYVICDPTYIGAPAGMSMPVCKRQKAEVVRIP